MHPSVRGSKGIPGSRVRRTARHCESGLTCHKLCCDYRRPRIQMRFRIQEKVERAVFHAVALRGRWKKGRSRSGGSQEVRPVVPVTTRQPTPLLPRWRFGAAPGSHKKYVSWRRLRHGCSSHSLRAYVGVPVIGACCTMRVHEDVGGGRTLTIEVKGASYPLSL